MPKKLKSLIMTNQQISEESIKKLIKIIRSGADLTHLRLEWLTPCRSLVMLFEAVGKNYNITSADLAAHIIGTTYLIPYHSAIEQHWGILSTSIDGYPLRSLEERNIKFAKGIADIILQENFIYLKQNNTNHLKAFNSKLTLNDFHKLEHGGYAALKYFLATSHKKSEDEIACAIDPLAHLHTLVLIRDLFTSDLSKNRALQYLTFKEVLNSALYITPSDNGGKIIFEKMKHLVHHHNYSKVELSLE